MKLRATIGILLAIFIGLVVFSRFNASPKVEQTKDIYNNMVGKQAPDFDLANNLSSRTSLKSLRGKKVVLFFNEGLTCYPACWNQIAELGKDSDLNNDNVATVSIVPNEATDWVSAFQRQPDLAKETILYDPSLTVAKAYGVIELASSMHKGVQPGHTYIILDRQGIVRYTYDDSKMGIENDLLKKELSKIE